MDYPFEPWSPEAIAYAVGLFEGEGTVGLMRYGKRDHAYLRIEFQMTDREPLEMFRHAIGQTGGVKGPYKRHPDPRVGIQGRKDTYRVTVRGGFAVQRRVLEAFWPFLSPRRRDQVSRAIAGVRLGDQTHPMSQTMRAARQSPAP
jgi:hypothetical protein